MKKERQQHKITKGTEQTVPLVRFLIGSILSVPFGVPSPSESLRSPPERVTMKRTIGLISLCIGICCRVSAESQCPALEGVKLKEQIEYLKHNRSELQDGCITYAMFQIAAPLDRQDLAQYPEAIRTLVGYLDYRRPDISRLSRAVSSNRAPYPASDALFIIGRPVVPDLIEVIANPSASDISRTNATSVIFAILSRDNISDGIQMLKRAAILKESADWQGSQRLMDAARKMAGMCKGDMANVCMDALFK